VILPIPFGTKTKFKVGDYIKVKIENLREYKSISETALAHAGILFAKNTEGSKSRNIVSLTQVL
jgi:hypothetical protein